MRLGRDKDGEMLRGFRLVGARVFTDPTQYEWTVSSIGMLRVDLDEDHRLNFWDSRFITNNTVARIHNHPWDFSSMILFGVMTCVTYRERTDPAGNYYRYDVPCGEERKPVDFSQAYMTRNLALLERNRMSAGHIYALEKHEIHEASPEDGCLTMQHKVGDKGSSARVYWPKSWGKGELQDQNARPAGLADIQFAQQIMNLTYEEHRQEML